MSRTSGSSVPVVVQRLLSSRFSRVLIGRSTAVSARASVAIAAAEGAAQVVATKPYRHQADVGTVP